jgi:hypothetical protein
VRHQSTGSRHDVHSELADDPHSAVTAIVSPFSTAAIYRVQV